MQDENDDEQRGKRRPNFNLQQDIENAFHENIEKKKKKKPIVMDFYNTNKALIMSSSKIDKNGDDINEEEPIKANFATAT